MLTMTINAKIQPTVPDQLLYQATSVWVTHRYWCEVSQHKQTEKHTANHQLSNLQLSDIQTLV
jgi:hypothetical protein